MWRPDRALALPLAAGVVTTVLVVWMGFEAARRGVFADGDGRGGGFEVADVADDLEPLREDKRKVSDAERAELLTRAQVWREPRVPVSHASLTGTTLDELSCRFKVSDLGGTTPKFDCELEDGEEIRIKYGNGPEVPAEAAATRLLKALGFGADDITIVRKLRCYGCPKEPFSVMKAVEITRSEPLYKQVVDFGSYEEFDWVGLERKLDARPVETEQIEGWSFFELEHINATAGGAPRAHVDALRIMAVLLAHWDNKSENQRIVCTAREWPEDSPCPAPFLLLQDVGATFGPTKLDLAAWEQIVMWDDRSACSLSMRQLPFNGATFGQARVTESGRQFIANLLSQLSDRQLTDLFTHARFGEDRGPFAPTEAVADWVRVFKHKVRAISEGPACPAA